MEFLNEKKSFKAPCPIDKNISSSLMKPDLNNFVIPEKMTKKIILRNLKFNTIVMKDKSLRKNKKFKIKQNSNKISNKIAFEYQLPNIHKEIYNFSTKISGDEKEAKIILNSKQENSVNPQRKKKNNSENYSPNLYSQKMKSISSKHFAELDNIIGKVFLNR